MNLPEKIWRKRNGYCRSWLVRHRWAFAEFDTFDGSPVLVIRCKRCPAESVDLAGVWR